MPRTRTVALIILAVLASRDGVPQVSRSRVPEPRGEATAIAISQDAKRVATGDRDGNVTVWDAAGLGPEKTFRGHTRPISSVAFSPSGATLASGSFDQSIKLWNLSSGTPRMTLRTSGQAKSLSFSPSGDWLASTGADGVQLWDLRSGRKVRKIPSSRGVVAASFSPDGRRISIAGGAGIKVWETTSGELLQTMENAGEALYLCVAFSSDGRMLAAGGTDKIARLWDAATGEPLREFAGGADFVRSVAFSMDGRSLTAADRTAVRSWDLRSGELRRLIRSDESLRSTALSPDAATWAGVGVSGVPRAVPVR